jgi:hypothetical protein
MSETITRVTRALRRALPNDHRTTALAAHDEAMRDRGIADDHAASIARAVASGRPGCEFCA